MSWIEVPSVSMYENFNITELGIDQAWVNVSTAVTSSLRMWLYELSTDCYKCPYQRKMEIISGEQSQFKLKTMFPMKYRFRLNGEPEYVPEYRPDSDMFCDVGEYNFKEFGVYDIFATGNAMQDAKCGVKVLVEPVNIYLPLVIVALFYLLLALVTWFFTSNQQRLKKIFGFSSASRTSSRTEINPTDTNEVRRISSVAPSNAYNHTNGHSGNPTTEVTISTETSIPTSAESEKVESPSSVRRASSAHAIANVSDNSNSNQKSPSQNLHHQQSASSAPQQKPSKPRQRLRSLDTFRGICITIMIFVNDGGAGYYFFEHATWDGLYIADLVFPWFLWCMGISTAISISSQVKRKTSRLTILKRITIRSLKLIGIGLMLGSLGGPVNIETMRLPGVLQRFGICYFVTSTLVLICMTANFSKPEESKFKAALQDVQIIWISWFFVLLLVLTHCILTFFLSVPGCPTGYLGPGGLHENNAYGKICIGGASGYIDRQVLTLSHLYQWPTAKATYKSEAYDPEGVLGLLTSVFQVWLGVQTGMTMLVFPRASSRLKRWGVWAAATGAAGALLCQCSQNGGWIPINKNLWSLSFVLVTNCMGLILLSALYFVIDIKKWWSGSPFFEPGMNSLLLYVGHSVGNSMLPWHYVYGSMRTHFSKLVESCWGTSLWVIIAVYLYQKKTFWTI